MRREGGGGGDDATRRGTAWTGATRERTGMRTNVGVAPLSVELRTREESVGFRLRSSVTAFARCSKSDENARRTHCTEVTSESEAEESARGSISHRQSAGRPSILPSPHWASRHATFMD